MKKILQSVAFVAILVFGFWVGMQWWSGSNVPPIDYKQVPTPVPPVTPAPVVPVVSAEVVTPNAVEETPPVVPVETKIPEEVTPVDLPTPKNEKVNHYRSNYFKYGFDIPANLYYSAFGASDGAQHTVAIAKEVPETFADGAVKVYFYGKKILPELQNVSSGKYEDPAGKYISILLGGQYSVKIEASDIRNPIVQKIVQTIALES